MIKLALIGKNIKHSKSKLVYEKILGQKISYELIDIEDESKLPSLDSLKMYQGISITSPYKKNYLNSCDLTEEAKEIEAINCLFFKEDKWFATNTDYLAVQELILNFSKVTQEKKVLIYGSGPMAKVIQKVLEKNQTPYEALSRKNLNFEKYKSLPKSSSYFVINCLTRGVKIPLLLDADDTVWDLNYLNLEVIEDYLSKPHYFDGESLLFRQAQFALSFWKIKDLLNS